MGGVTVDAAPSGEARAGRSELAVAAAAGRGQAGLVAALLGAAAVAWWWTAEQMAGMDAGPGSSLGTLGWFMGVWVVMMAAMMLPSLAPTTALYARMTRRRAWTRPLLFTSGYLIVWGATGLLAYAVFTVGRTWLGADLAWRDAGRWVAGGTILLAAIYELTPLKHACLGKSRSPLGFLLEGWRDGQRGALEMGCRHAAWCLGCCWALMAALFALGVMSLAWMAVIAVLIALEKTLPWRRVATWGTAALLIALAVAVVAVPHNVPALVIPPGAHGGASMSMMR